MEDDEVVLSEVHMETSDYISTGSVSYRCSSATTIDVKVVLSRFPFEWPLGECTTNNKSSSNEHYTNSEISSDEDGDLVVQRKNPTSVTCEVVVIEHGLASPLSLVGLQVWTGALLLNDFILHLGCSLAGSKVLELGAGTGMCSVVASMFANQVICTDVGLDVLNLCHKNVERNKHLTSWNSRKDSLSIRVRELDWRKGFPPPRSSDIPGPHQWCWTEKDIQDANNCDVILAADVIYDEHITEHLFKLLAKMFTSSVAKTAYLSLEKRLNFTLSSLDVSCPAYTHFLETVNVMKQLHNWDAYKLTCNFQQFFSYQRNKYLELWKLTSGR